MPVVCYLKVAEQSVGGGRGTDAVEVFCAVVTVVLGVGPVLVQIHTGDGAEHRGQ